MNNNIKILTLILLVVNIFSLRGQDLGQGNLNPYSSITAPSPEAVAFKKFGDYPVSYYTGVPDISIPIYIINVDKVQIPISLKYHSAGNKVSEAASWVGLGWTLIAGGVLSRNIKGIPDESHMGYLNSHKGYVVYPTTLEDPTYYETPWNLTNELGYLIDVAQGSRDSESDEYSINFMDLNANFVFDTNGAPRCYPHSDLKIQRDLSGEMWTVKDTKGVVYYFEEKETISKVSINNDNGFAPNQADDRIGKCSGWYIKKVITPNGQKIEFHYAGFNGTMSVSTSESLARIKLADENGYPHKEYHSYLQTKIYHYAPKLSKITFPKGEVIFSSSEDPRQDIEGFASSLGSIEIKDKKLKPVKKYLFNYEYFDSDNPNGSNEFYLFKRLKLVSIEEISNDSTESLSTSFHYFEDRKLPHLLSHAQDHWGFNNGYTGNDDARYKFIPDDSYIALYNNIYYQYSGAIRTPRFPEMKAWVLERIDYPTGGYSIFEFEPHEYFEEGTSVLNEEFRTTSFICDNESVTSTNEVLVNKIYIHEFEVSGISGRPAEASITIDFAWPTGGRDDHKVYIREKGMTENIFYYEHHGDGGIVSGKKANLFSGKSYELVMESNLGMPDKVNVNVKYRAYVQGYKSGGNKIAGGLRIKKIKDYTGENSDAIVKEYSYYLAGTMNSSARLGHQFKYFITYNSNVLSPSGIFNSQFLNSKGSSEILQPAAEIWSSNSINGLGTTKGSSVGYQRVEEKRGYEKNGVLHQGIGKTVRNFTTPDNSSPYILQDFMSGYMSSMIIEPIPNGTNVIPEYLWSVIKAQQAWNSNPIYPFIVEKRKNWEEGLLTNKSVLNSSGHEVYSLSNGYSFAVNQLAISEGLKVQSLPYNLAYSNNRQTYCHIPNNASYKRYYLYSDRVRLNKTIENRYLGNEIVTQTKTYQYEEQHLKLIEESTKNSSGDTIKTFYEYPFDNLDLQSLDMVSNNFLPLLKSYSMNGSKIISGHVANYEDKYFSNELGRKVYLPKNVEVFSSSDWETKVLFDFYDDQGNLLQQRMKDNFMLAYVWGYNKQYPVVMAENIGYAILKIAVEKAAKTTDFEIFWGNLTNPSYGNKTWDSFNEDLRNNPVLKGALVTTYTYAPLIGMTSQTDPNGRTTYYQYDDFGRLEFIRDQDYNIIKKYEYKYASETSN